jgi:hypothetical protein
VSFAIFSAILAANSNATSSARSCGGVLSPGLRGAVVSLRELPAPALREVKMRTATTRFRSASEKVLLARSCRHWERRPGSWEATEGAGSGSYSRQSCRYL